MSNKESLIDDIVRQYMNTVPDHRRLIVELLKEALSHYTIKELKEKLGE